LVLVGASQCPLDLLTNRFYGPFGWEETKNVTEDSRLVKAASEPDDELGHLAWHPLLPFLSRDLAIEPQTRDYTRRLPNVLHETVVCLVGDVVREGKSLGEL